MAATIAKSIKFLTNFNNSNILYKNLSFGAKCTSNLVLKKLGLPIYSCAGLHTTSRRWGLEEFFEEEKNWNKQKIQTGRPWKEDELRLKSNEDLHKLWYVLLKERNMLMTMEEACKNAWEVFPNPERIDKVEISMENLEKVVRERNEAYWQLETGYHGEVPTKFQNNVLGLSQYYRLSQHVIPKKYNKSWREKYLFGYSGFAVRKFISLYKEKCWNIKRKLINHHTRGAMKCLRKFPNLDLDAVMKEFPKAQLGKALRQKSKEGDQLVSRKANYGSSKVFEQHF